LKLATYLYKDDDPNTKRHLGFIIDDLPAQGDLSPAISGDGRTVDLYGLISMLVSTVQQQALQTKILQLEISELQQKISNSGKKNWNFLKYI